MQWLSFQLSQVTIQQKEESANRTDIEITTCLYEKITNDFFLIHFFNTLYSI